MPVTTCAASASGRIDRSPGRGSLEPVAPTHREERRADGDEHVRTEAGGLLVELPFEPDEAAEARGGGEPHERLARSRSGSIARSSDCILLCASDHRDAPGGQLEQLVQLVAPERHPLGGRLHLDQPAVARHHHVQVDVGGESSE